MNKIQIVGNLTSAPEIKYLESGKRVASVTIASDRGRGENAGTDFIRLSAWEESADALMTFSKGDWVSVKGSLRTERYEKDDEPRYASSVNVRKIEAGPSKKEAA